MTDTPLSENTQIAAHYMRDFTDALCETVKQRAQNEQQYMRHGLAWFATYAEALTQLSAYCVEMQQQNRLGALEQNLVALLFGDYLAQMRGGIMMSQNEIIRPQDLGISDIDRFFSPPALAYFCDGQAQAQRRKHIAHMLAQQNAMGGDSGLDDTHSMMRDQFRRFTDDKVTPHAHGWHLRDDFIPLALISEMAALGVFGLTIPENYGGSAMGKQAMCVVSEELSRGFIGVGSLGTRTDIASELILANGTDAQKQNYLPKIANGEILPTAVFTEPDNGSDLANLTTRAQICEVGYRIYGNKIWITHAARADMMTLLARTNEKKGHGGISMFLAEKPRGNDALPFPATGMNGGEISVLGYRGMKEYDIGFDGFLIPHDALLGGKAGEGQGFKQLMQTFESARIQTAARAIGVAQAAQELAFDYAHSRIQFGQPLYTFERVYGKIAMMAAEILCVRQLTYFAARQKDSGKRCDLEAGMAKLLAARIAWAAADNAVQIHGGNGFALEFPISRILCDARILSIFEGAAEIQAEVIARRLLEH